MGKMQKNNKVKTRQYVLYVWTGKSQRLKLAHGAYVGKGKPGGLHEIRFKGVTATMYDLQRLARREGSGFLQKYVKGNRPRSNGETRSRSAGNRKGL